MRLNRWKHAYLITLEGLPVIQPIGNQKIALSNLTGSPEGPGFPGFPLAPWKERKKLCNVQETSWSCFVIMCVCVCVCAWDEKSYFQSRNPWLSYFPFIAYCCPLVEHHGEHTLRHFLWPQLEKYMGGMEVDFTLISTGRSMMTEIQGIKLTGSPLGPGGPSAPGLPCGDISNSASSTVTVYVQQNVFQLTNVCIHICNQSKALPQLQYICIVQ